MTAPHLAYSVSEISEMFLQARLKTPAAPIDLAMVMAGDPARPGQARGAVRFGVGEFNAVVTPAGARHLAEWLTKDRRWALALPYDPEALAAHFRAFSDRAERAAA